MKRQLAICLIFTLLYTTRTTGQSCGSLSFIQSTYLLIERDKENPYDQLLDKGWEYFIIALENKEYLPLDRKQFKKIETAYHYNVFEEKYLSGSIIQLTVPKTEKYSKVKILLNRSEEKDLQQLYELGLDVDHGHYHRNEFFESDFSQTEISLIKAAGFQFEIVVDDVVAYYANQQATPPPTPENACNATGSTEYQTPANWSLGTLAGYFTYQEMLEQLDSMAAKYPNLISARQPIDANNLTHNGNPIYWLRISDNPNTNEAEPQILYDALHHAREPGSLSQLIFYMWYLLENYGTDAEITYLVDNAEMYFVPCVNPDGYIYNQQISPSGGGLWRKNRRLNSPNDYGVDLNRNYGYQWGYDNQGSSPNTTSATYRGPAAFSEPETQNMRDFTTAHQFRIAMNYHTYGNMLVYPWGYSDQLTPDGSTFIDFSDIMTRENNYIKGTGTQTVGYVVNGDSDDWMYGDTILKNKIISMTPEVGYSFWAASNDIETICKDNLFQNIMAAHLILNYGEVVDQTGNYITATTGHIHYDFKRYGFENGGLTVNFVPVSSNIASFAGNSKTFQLAQLQTVSDSFSYTLNANIVAGDAIVFIAEVSNGLWTSRDTIRKYYQDGAPTYLLNDDFATGQNWQNNLGNAWTTTTTDFYSAPKSMTDSPNGNYTSNAMNQIISTNAIDLSNAISATLTYWAKWNLETSYDFVQVGGSSTASSNYTPLCGLYTHAGGQSQAFNEQLYDGLQSTWVEESIDLSDFLGGNFYLSFTLISDPWVEEDGFYFDDVKIQVNYETGSQTMDLKDFVIKQNQPNPAQTFTDIELENAPKDAQLVIYNTVGQEMYRKNIQENRIKINTTNWTTGVYFYRVESEAGVSESFKIIKN
jgi:carboxypeptidase T